MDFEAGALVTLKSGGPVMTVEQVGERSYTNEPLVWCVWFERVGNKQVVHRDTFPPQVLEKTSDTSGSTKRLMRA